MIARSPITELQLRIARACPRLQMGLIVIAIAAFALMITDIAHAGTATWSATPVSGNWNTAANWVPMRVPNGSSDIARFDFSNQTGISLSANAEVSGIAFNAGASPYTITVDPTHELVISGEGITNNSGITQDFVANVDLNEGRRGTISFHNSATAGDLVAFDNRSSQSEEVIGTAFFDTSTAGNATFINRGAELFSVVIRRSLTRPTLAQGRLFPMEARE